MTSIGIGSRRGCLSHSPPHSTGRSGPHPALQEVEVIGIERGIPSESKYALGRPRGAAIRSVAGVPRTSRKRAFRNGYVVRGDLVRRVRAFAVRDPRMHPNSTRENREIAAMSMKPVGQSCFTGLDVTGHKELMHQMAMDCERVGLGLTTYISSFGRQPPNFTVVS